MSQFWKDTELPPSGEMLYECIGAGWHYFEYHDPHNLRWMQGEAGTRNPEDGFYCRSCINEAEREVKKGIRSKVVLGPTLNAELERRRGPYRPPMTMDEWMRGWD